MLSLARRLREAISNGQWERVTELVTVGIPNDLILDVVGKAITHGRWDVVLVLVKDCANTQLIDYVLREAVRHNQWRCVVQLLNHSNMVSKQQVLCVCQEACARRMRRRQEFRDLERGAYLASDTVEYAFENNQGEDILRLLMDGFVALESRVFILKAAVQYKRLDIFSALLDSQTFTDQELRKALVMMISSSSHAFLKELLTRSRGVRVFKQLCRTRLQVSRDILVHMYSYLYMECDINLAFYVGCTQGLWDTVLQHYEDEGISARSRQFALKLAMKQGAWVYVTKMADKSVTQCHSRRQAFLEAVRQEEWLWAMKFYDRADTPLTNCDLRFTLNVCLFLDVFDVYLEFCKRFSAAGKSNVILTVARAALKAAARGGAVELAWRAYQRDTLPLSPKTFVWILRNIRKSSDVWEKCVPVLNSLTLSWWEDLKAYVIDLKWHLLNRERFPRFRALAKWCLSHSYENFALFLALISEDWVLVERVVETSGTNISKENLREGFQLAFHADEIDATVSFLRYLTPDDINVFHLYDFEGALLDICRDKGLHLWAVELSLITNDWDVLEEEVEFCQDQDLIDRVGLAAASENEWHLVQTILKKCSQSTLKEILCTAIGEGELECAKAAIAIVDPCCVGSDFRPDSILYHAVESYDNSEEMVRLCIKSGVSTFQRLDQDEIFSPMRCALNNGQLPLVRLLHESGSCSNRELYQLKNDASIREELERQDRQDIVQYVDQAASNPGSLQHLARLAVSHLIGCWPGRYERVHALEMAPCLYEYVMFEDVLS